jgi:hypothetical protein
MMVESLLMRARSMSRLVSDTGTGRGVRMPKQLRVTEVVPYCKPKHAGSWRESQTAGSNTVAPVVAAHVAFPDASNGFDPVPFSPGEFREAYLHPDSLLLSEEDVPVSTSKMGSMAAVPELKALCWRWDAVGRLSLFLESEVDDGDTATVFCVVKDEHEDRQIIDRRPRNARERPPPPGIVTGYHMLLSLPGLF